MDEILNCILSIDEANQKIMIANLQEQNFEINFTSDIDFTDLVSILTEQIDEQKPIELTIKEEPSDEKLKLITYTIKEIFEIYNESLSEAGEEADDTLQTGL